MAGKKTYEELEERVRELEGMRGHGNRVNQGHNKEMLLACRPLGEYAWLVAQARENLLPGRDGRKVTIGEAIDRAIDGMPEDFVIREFIMANRAEVKDMCLTEYNEMETMEMLWQEGREEGREEGRRDGLQEAALLYIRNLMDSTGWTAEKIMEMLKILLSQRNALYAGLSK